MAVPAINFTDAGNPPNILACPGDISARAVFHSARGGAEAGGVALGRMHMAPWQTQLGRCISNRLVRWHCRHRQMGSSWIGDATCMLATASLTGAMGRRTLAKLTMPGRTGNMP